VKLREVVAKLQEIKNRGFIPSLRRGSTGIGYTFETVLAYKKTIFQFQILEGGLK
jgi:hypothetical protein